MKRALFLAAAVFFHSPSYAMEKDVEGQNLLDIKRVCITPSFKGMKVEVIGHKPLWSTAYTLKDPALTQLARDEHDKANLKEFKRLTESQPPEAGTQAWRRLMGLRRMAATKAESEKLNDLERAALANCMARQYMKIDAQGPGVYTGILSICRKASGNCSAITRMAHEFLQAMNVDSKLVLTGELGNPRACMATKPTHEMVDFYIQGGEGLKPYGWLRMEPQMECPDPNTGACLFAESGKECPGPEHTTGPTLLPD